MTNYPFEEEEVKNKLNTIKFRGPDNLGYLKTDNLSLGHLRLSIIDLEERSNQPFSYENLHMVFNGEIYNYIELRDTLKKEGYTFSTSSDTEVLIKGYHYWGNDVLEKINGMFAFSIYDKSKNIVFSARDRVGVKPFFYTWQDEDGQFEICSQINPLTNRDSKINRDAISAYLSFGYIPSPNTILENTYKLSPGNYMIIDLSAKTRVEKPYWHIENIQVNNNISFNEAKRELKELLKDAVKIRMRSDVPLVSFLSGGVDSALVSSMASEISGENNLNTLTIGFDNEEYNEAPIAKTYSTLIKTNHFEQFCTPKDLIKQLDVFFKVYGEPFADSSAIPSLLLNQIAKETATVALSGDGGDEGFYGYKSYDLLDKAKKVLSIPYFIRKIISKVPFYKLMKIKKEVYEKFMLSKNMEDLCYKLFLVSPELTLGDTEKWKHSYNYFFNDNQSRYNKLSAINIKLWLENDSCVKVDRASMAYQVEVRSPLLDYRVLEYAKTLPDNFKINQGKKKIILREILKDYIPENVFDVPKKGFSIPLGSWIREELKEEFQKELSLENLKKIPDLNLDVFQNQLKQHFNSKMDYSDSIWKVYILIKWIHNFENKVSQL